MDSKNQKIILAIIVFVAVVFGLMGGHLYVQWRQGQIADVGQVSNEVLPSEAPWARPDGLEGLPSDIGQNAANADTPSAPASGEELTEMPDDDALDSMPDDGTDTSVSSAGEGSVAQNEAKPSVSASPKLTPEQEAKKKELEKLLHKEHIEYYQNYIKDPDKLGFVPDGELFRTVYIRIRSSYVDDVKDKDLYDGVIKEVGVLLEAAGIPKDGLKKLDPDRNALSQLDELYGGKIDQRVLYYSAIQGMLVGLNDPYSVLMSPEEFNSLQEEVQSKGFGGIGIYIEMDREADNQITVMEPVEDTPAYAAGLESGDQILSIDGISTKGMALDIATKHIRGPIDSTVVLKIRRKGVAEPFEVKVKRAMIHIVSTTGKMLDGNIGYVRLRQFGAKTAEEIDKELNKLKGEGAKGLILDLRNNGGGYIDASISVVGEFVPKNSLVVYTEGRVEKRYDYKSAISPKAETVPMVVLVNRFSASASEITAGALRDHHRAKLIGETSFGKGSVQQLFPGGDGSALKLTVAHFFSPSGYKIDKQGLKPDVELEMDPRFVGKKDKDTQLKRALQYIEQGN